MPEKESICLSIDVRSRLKAENDFRIGKGGHTEFRNTIWRKRLVLRDTILKTAPFLGNDEDISNEREACTMCRSCSARRPDTIRDARGSAARAMAAPEGRFAGAAFMVGIGNTAGKDREGLTALRKSAAQSEPGDIPTGPCVRNSNVDPVMIREEDRFEKIVRMVETCFRNDGIRFQLNSVQSEERKAVKANPDDSRASVYGVSGYSADFALPPEEIQENLIARTLIRG